MNFIFVKIAGKTCDVILSQQHSLQVNAYGQSVDTMSYYVVMQLITFQITSLKEVFFHKLVAAISIPQVHNENT